MESVRARPVRCDGAHTMKAHILPVRLVYLTPTLTPTRAVICGLLRTGWLPLLHQYGSDLIHGTNCATTATNGIPYEVTIWRYRIYIPVAVSSFIVFPLWHRTKNRAKAWSVRVVYSWAHLSAILDVIRHRPMGWSPTGTTMRGGNARY
jgi:hypothetical protein